MWLWRYAGFRERLMWLRVGSPPITFTFLMSHSVIQSAPERSASQKQDKSEVSWGEEGSFAPL